MADERRTRHDPAKPVSTNDELDALLIAGLESGEPRRMTDEDWQQLRRRALARADIRKIG